MTTEVPAELDSVLGRREYSPGFITDIESETLPPGLDESVIRAISAKKDEPQWLLVRYWCLAV